MAGINKIFLKIIIAAVVFLLISAPAQGFFDMHEHFRAGGNIKLYLYVAKKLGITKTIFVPTGSAPDNGGYKKHMAALLKKQKLYSKRVIVFCTVDDEDALAPQIFEKCLESGGRGLKLINGHPDYYDAAIDSEIMKKLFAIAQKRSVPVMIHMSIYRLPKALEEFKRLKDEFPLVRVQLAHYGNVFWNGVHLDMASQLLDKYPNLYIDIAMGGGMQGYLEYLKNDLQQVKDFILKYQNRIFFGGDIILSHSGISKQKKWLTARIKCELDLLREKEFSCPVVMKSDEILTGFNFSEEVLLKIFTENPKKFLKLN